MSERPPHLSAAAAALRGGATTADALDAAARVACGARADALNCHRWLADRAGEPVPDGAPPPGASPLWGIPGAVKANLCVRGRPTDCGSRLLEDWRPPYDATVVARLRAAGARVIAGTAMDEFGMGSSGEHHAFGPVRNPLDRARTPGGSSAGAAASVAAGLTLFALGSDTGGSVRLPAHCCGLVGMKPTYGRVSRYGLVAFASSLDVVGPLTRDVAGNAAVLAAIAGPDRRDATSRDAPVGDYVAASDRDAAGLVVAAPRRWVDRHAEPDVAAAFRTALDDLKSAGVAIVDADLPDPDLMLACYAVVSAAEAMSNLARFDGAALGRRAPGPTYRETARRSRTAGLGAEVKRRILLGAYVLCEGYRDAAYDAAVRARRAIARAHAAILARADALALPTAPTVAFPLGERLGDPWRMAAADVFTVGASLSGLPALSVPCGAGAAGLPVGLQLVGRDLGEETLYTLAGTVARSGRWLP